MRCSCGGEMRLIATDIDSSGQKWNIYRCMKCGSVIRLPA